MVRAGVIPQKDNLQQGPPEGVARWLEVFRNKGSVILYNLSPCEKVPSEGKSWTVRAFSVCSVPLMLGGQVAGFIEWTTPLRHHPGRHPGPCWPAL